VRYGCVVSISVHESNVLFARTAGHGAMAVNKSNGQTCGQLHELRVYWDGANVAFFILHIHVRGSAKE